MKKLLTLGFAALLLAGCSSAKVTYPKGVQKVHALIQSAPLDLNRRGTYQLLTGATLFAFAESQFVNLHPYEGQIVELTGTYEANTRTSDLPVLVVTAVKSNEPDKKSWTIPSLGLTIKTPLGWKTTLIGSGVSFATTGSFVPLRILSARYDEKAFSLPAPKGFTRTVFSIGGSRAIQFTDDRTGGTMLTVDRGALPSIKENVRFLVFTFLAVPGQSRADAVAIFDAIIKSIRIGDSAQTSSGGGTYSVPVIPSSTGTVTVGSPCGGVAGILCPAGTYCAITDRALNIGTCKAM